MRRSSLSLVVVLVGSVIVFVAVTLGANPYPSTQASEPTAQLVATFTPTAAVVAPTGRDRATQLSDSEYRSELLAYRDTNLKYTSAVSKSLNEFNTGQVTDYETWALILVANIMDFEEHFIRFYPVRPPSELSRFHIELTHANLYCVAAGRTMMYALEQDQSALDVSADLWLYCAQLTGEAMDLLEP